MTDVGKVAGLYRYPVQSVRGEGLASLTFGPAGISGDRAYAIADLELGVVAHASRAKKPYRQLITWNARFLGEPADGAEAPLVELDFGDASIRSDDTRIDRAISDRLGMPAAFVRNDGSRVPKLYEPSHCHVLTSATVAKLQENHPGGDFDAARFRPNLYLDSGNRVGYIEQDWMNMTLSAGGAVFEINDVCKRCALTTRAQGGLPADPGILQATALNQTIAGMYGSVVRQGRIQLGDEAAVGA